MSETVLEVNNVSKTFELIRPDSANRSLFSGLLNRNGKNNGQFYALKNISFSLKKGEVLGVIGKNGSGKSTLLKLLSEIMYPSHGSITYKGRLTSILDIGSGFHPELSGRDNALMYGTLLGLDRKEIEAGMEQIIEFSEIGNFIDEPVKYYSNGMYLRLAFSVAFFCRVDIMVLDEVLSVGDAAFMIKCFDRIKAIRDQGTSIILVSHNMSDIIRMCSQCIWLENGEIFLYGDTHEVVSGYLQSHWRTSRDSGNLDSESLLSTANLEWPQGKGPGNKLVTLRKIKISNTSGDRHNGHIDYNLPIKIELVYEQSHREPIYCVFTVIDHYNNPIFTTTPLFEPVTGYPAGPGMISSACIIPPRMLNLGVYKLHLRIMYNDREEVLDIQDFAFFKVVTAKPEQEALLRKSPISISALFEWKVDKIG